MKVIERREPPWPTWAGPWQCNTCQPILEPESQSEIWEEAGQYTQADYFTHCPVCETRRSISRPVKSGLWPAPGRNNYSKTGV